MICFLCEVEGVLIQLLLFFSLQFLWISRVMLLLLLIISFGLVRVLLVRVKVSVFRVQFQYFFRVLFFQVNIGVLVVVMVVVVWFWVEKMLYEVQCILVLMFFRVLISIVVWMVMCSELVMCMFFSGSLVWYLWWIDIRFGILCLVMFSFLWFQLVSVILWIL